MQQNIAVTLHIADVCVKCKARREYNRKRKRQREKERDGEKKKHYNNRDILMNGFEKMSSTGYSACMHYETNFSHCVFFFVLHCSAFVHQLPLVFLVKLCVLSFIFSHSSSLSSPLFFNTLRLIILFFSLCLLMC